jgi:hypothetical protein
LAVGACLFVLFTVCVRGGYLKTGCCYHEFYFILFICALHHR